MKRQAGRRERSFQKPKTRSLRVSRRSSAPGDCKPSAFCGRRPYWPRAAHETIGLESCIRNEKVIDKHLFADVDVSPRHHVGNGIAGRDVGLCGMIEESRIIPVENAQSGICRGMVLEELALEWFEHGLVFSFRHKPVAARV